MIHTRSSAADSFAAVVLLAAGSFAAAELLDRRPSSSGVLFCTTSVLSDELVVLNPRSSSASSISDIESVSSYFFGFI
jgi:hypothetical protein